MSAITIKNISPDTHHSLKARAEANGRSLNREIIMTLERSLHSVRVDAENIRRQAKSVRESAGLYMTQKELTELKNAGRE